MSLDSLLQERILPLLLLRVCLFPKQLHVKVIQILMNNEMDRFWTSIMGVRKTCCKADIKTVDRSSMSMWVVCLFVLM